MSDSVWIVGQSLGVEGEEVLWRKIGTFVDLALAESWMAYTKADILLEQTQPGVSVLPTFSQIGISFLYAEQPKEGGTCH